MILKPRPFRKPKKGHWATKNFVGCWLMNESSGDIIADLSGNGRNLTFYAQGNSVWTAAKFGTGVEMFGGGWDILYTIVPELYRQPKTFITWMKRTATGDYCGIFNVADDASDASPQTLVRINKNTDRLETFGAVPGGSGYDYLETSEIITNDGEFHQIVFVDRCDGAQAYHLYLDGKECNYAAGIDTYQDYVNTADNFWLGAGYTGAYAEAVFDHCMILNRALSTSEIALLYRNPFCMFDYEPIELWAAATIGGAPPVGNVGIMTPNTGYWGPTF